MVAPRKQGTTLVTHSTKTNWAEKNGEQVQSARNLPSLKEKTQSRKLQKQNGPVIQEALLDHMMQNWDPSGCKPGLQKTLNFRMGKQCLKLAPPGVNTERMNNGFCESDVAQSPI